MELNEYYFYIFHSNISIDSKDKLKYQIKNYRNCKLQFINCTSWLNNSNIYLAKGNWSQEVYYKLFIPFAIQKLKLNYKKILYLDSDMICLNDIALLTEINIGSNIIAGVPDTAIISYWNKKKYRKKYYQKEYTAILNLKNRNKYINGGLIIFDIDAYCKQFSKKKLLKLAASKPWKANEQDMFNEICQENIMVLPIKWNFMVEPVTNADYLPENLKQDYASAIENPSIIHFTMMKPWKSYIVPLYSWLFWKYASQSPFFDEIIQRLKNENVGSMSIEGPILDAIRNNKGLGWTFIKKCISARLAR
jgi:lipopolysaccharide biosynthesis glycosyltransferase